MCRLLACVQDLPEDEEAMEMGTCDIDLGRPIGVTFNKRMVVKRCNADGQGHRGVS